MVGTPVAGRTRAELERVVGFLVNTVALRTDCSGDPTFGALLGRVRETALAPRSTGAAFERLVEALAVPRDPGRNPLFQVLSPSRTRRPGARASRRAHGACRGRGPHGKLDLTWAVQDRGRSCS